MEENAEISERKKYSSLLIYSSVCFFTLLIISLLIHLLSTKLDKIDRKNSALKDLKHYLMDKNLNNALMGLPYGDSDRNKLIKIKKSFTHLWNQYKARAWGHDVISETGEYSDNSGYAETMIAATSTLFLMNMIKEVREIDAFYNKTVIKPKGTVKRSDFMGNVVSAFMSAYDLTEMPTFLTHFMSLVHSVPTSSSVVFDTINYNDGSWLPSTNQMFNIHELSSSVLPLNEFYVHTNTKSFFYSAMKPIDDILVNSINPYIHQTYYNSTSKKEMKGIMSYESDGYSFYEILQKVNKLTRNSYPSLKVHNIKSTKIFIHKFIEEDSEGNAYLIRYNGLKKEKIVTLDSSLFAGMLLLNRDLINDYSEDVTGTAEKLGNGILKILDLNKNGIPPTTVRIEENGTLTPISNKYNLNFRVLESLLILYRSTHNMKYRDAAWKLFLAVNSTCRTDYGFTEVEVKPDGKCERINNEVDPRVFSGFFKYMYLMFSDSAFIDLDKWIFTPEGHILKRFEKRDVTMDSDVLTGGDRLMVF